MSRAQTLLLCIASSLLHAGCDGSATDESPDTIVQTESQQTEQQQPLHDFTPPVTQLQVAEDRKVELLPASVNPGPGLPYPTRSGYDIKSIQTDFWPNKDELRNSNLSGVAVNLVWSDWQPTQQTQCSGSQINYDGQCFTISRVFDDTVHYWSTRGVKVTGVLYGVPEWARITTGCEPSSPELGVFCVNRNPADYARFAGMIATRYNGLGGHGRMADFVIHNEVNMNQWYNIGCGKGVACDAEEWISHYSANYNAAYDRIISAQPTAKVFAPFAHQFATELDNPTANNPILSVQTVVRGLHSRAAGRKWRIAYHPYNRSLSSSYSSFDDLPYVTNGNLGVIVGWLRSEFPLQPESWQVHLTESGISSNGWSDEYNQDKAMCDSFRNVLGTPGIENYIYHRMQDHPYEAERGAAFGLRRVDGTAKPSWTTWAQMSGRNGQRNDLNCGFENLPYTRLTTFGSNDQGYRTSTRVVGEQFWELNSWYPLHQYQPGTYMAYECRADKGSYISTDFDCGGNLSMGPVGYVHEYNAADRVLLNSCKNNNGYYASDVDQCGSDELVEVIGYVRKNR